jgi:hypothetical protein
MIGEATVGYFISPQVFNLPLDAKDESSYELYQLRHTGLLIGTHPADLRMVLKLMGINISCDDLSPHTIFGEASRYFGN